MSYRRKERKIVNEFVIDGHKFKIELSIHAQKRLKSRNIDTFQCVGNILILGEKRILEYQKTGDDFMILDKENGFAIVGNIQNEIIEVITVINKADCWVKSGTKLIEL